MVLFTLSKHVTRWIGPPLFRLGLDLKSMMIKAPSTPSSSSWSSSVYTQKLVDWLVLLPYSQRLVSLRIYDDLRDAAANAADASADDDDYLHRNRLVQIVENTLRPLLLPTETWGDVMPAVASTTYGTDAPSSSGGSDSWTWGQDPRLVAWIRKELLVAQHAPALREALVAYPSLRRSPHLNSSTKRRSQPWMSFLQTGVWPTTTTADDKTTSSTSMENQGLPTSDTVVKALRLRQWNTAKDTQAVRRAMIPTATQLRGKVLSVQRRGRESRNGKDENELHYLNRVVDVSEDASTRDIPLVDIVDLVAGGHVAKCGPLNLLCEEASVYQWWTHEYVTHLGDYLWARAKQVQPQRATLVLDVGAGDGLLVRHLKEYVQHKVGLEEAAATSSSVASKTKRRKQRRNQKESHPIHHDATTNPLAVLSPTPITFVATDDLSWGIFAKAEVEKLSVEQSLAKYASLNRISNDNDDNVHKSPRQTQVIVLCSWMPMGQDWTALFRQANVDEYILIGEAEDGSCGHNWETWGNPDFYDSQPPPQQQNVKDDDGDDDATIPPYTRDGYVRWDMDDALTPFQFSRFDCALSKSGKTVSFRK